MAVRLWVENFAECHAKYVITKIKNKVIVRDTVSHSVLYRGDSVADAINYAINNLSRVHPEKVVVFGDMIIDKKITVKDNTILDLHNARLKCRDNMNDDMIETSGWFFAIVGGVLDGNKERNTKGSVLRIKGGSQRFYISDVKIINAKEHGVHVEGEEGNFVGVGVIKNCVVENCGKHGVFLGPWSADILIESVNAGGNGLNGVCLSASTSNIISNCFCWNNGNNGIDVYDADDNVIDSCRCDMNNRHGVRLALSERCVISNSNIYNNGSNGVLLESCKDCLVAGNMVKGNGENGVVLSDSDHNNVSSNIIMLNNQHGVSIYSSPENAVVGNLINSNGIAGDYDGVNVNDNGVKYSYRNVIVGNRILDAQPVKKQRCGVYVAYGDNYQIIVGNHVEGNRVTGVHNESPDSIVSKNYGYVNEKWGVVNMPAGSTRLTVTHGLAKRPNVVVVTPLARAGEFWVDNINDTTFEIVISSEQTYVIPFAWYAFHA